MKQHERFMAECFRLARKGTGRVSPNPLVGAVLVKKGRIVAYGYHRRFGGPHAEVNCIRSYRGGLKGVTLYVNLEPCAHFGKTPPCTDLILQSGIRNVVIGMKDPNPLVAGKGIRKLRQGGVNVVAGILENEARELNRFFLTHMKKRRPFVHVKIAQTLDGKIAERSGTRTLISGIEAQRLVHQWRAEHDAILVGANTIRIDDPLLMVRFVKGRDPAVVILDGNLSINPKARVLASAGKRHVIIFTSRQAAEKQSKKVRDFTLQGIRIILVPSKESTLDLNTVLRELYASGIGSILVEGGANVFTQCLQSKHIDMLSILMAPRFFGKGTTVVSDIEEDLDSSICLNGDYRIDTSMIGRDVLLQFTLNARKN